MNNTTLIFNPAIGDPFKPQTITMTFSDVLNNFSAAFLFKIELLSFMFLGVMLYLQWHTKQIQKEHYRAKKLNPDVEMLRRDKILCLLSDIFFIPAVAFALIFIGYETGWWN